MTQRSKPRPATSSSWNV
jgi:hypothetical protein